MNKINLKQEEAKHIIDEALHQIIRLLDNRELILAKDKLRVFDDWLAKVLLINDLIKNYHLPLQALETLALDTLRQLEQRLLEHQSLEANVQRFIEAGTLPIPVLLQLTEEQWQVIALADPELLNELQQQVGGLEAVFITDPFTSQAIIILMASLNLNWKDAAHYLNKALGIIMLLNLPEYNNQPQTKLQAFHEWLNELLNVQTTIVFRM